MKQTISILPCNRIVTLLGIILSTILILATTCSSFSIIVIEQQIKKYPNLYRQRQRQRQQQEYIFHPFSFKIQNTYHGKAIITSMMKADDNDKKDIDIANACAKKVPHRTLMDIIRLRGPVDSGYGRGGKKLGVPTANLPCSLFSNALNTVPTGVYFGWAVIEDNSSSTSDDDDDDDCCKKGRNLIHKAVVNVGYSPTFDGEENKEKIVEAHLIVNDGDIDGDFYGETMRLSLSGFLRPEMKFNSFPELIEAINNDVANAKDALDLSIFESLRADSFLVDCNQDWMGSSGGDRNASYEFMNFKETISEFYGQ